MGRYVLSAYLDFKWIGLGLSYEWDTKVVSLFLPFFRVYWCFDKIAKGYHFERL
jgi:hypothetical protein